MIGGYEPDFWRRIRLGDSFVGRVRAGHARHSAAWPTGRSPTSQSAVLASPFSSRGVGGGLEGLTSSRRNLSSCVAVGACVPDGLYLRRVSPPGA